MMPGVSLLPSTLKLRVDDALAADCRRRSLWEKIPEKTLEAMS